MANVMEWILTLLAAMVQNLPHHLSSFSQSIAWCCVVRINSIVKTIFFVFVLIFECMVKESKGDIVGVAGGIIIEWGRLAKKYVIYW